MQIHELNNFNGELNSGAYMVVDNGSDTGKVTVPQLLAETETNINKLANDLNSRIDNIIAGGTAPSAAEVTDARHGAFGKDYASLGDAVRGQASALAEIIESSFEANSLSANIERIIMSESVITNALSKGVTVTITGENKFKLNGTATGAFYLDLDWNLVTIRNRPLYFYIKRDDGAREQTGVTLALSYFNSSEQPISTNDKISSFNEWVPYSYASAAVTTRNYLNVASGATFSNVEFEIIILEKPPLDVEAIENTKNELLTSGYSYIAPNWVDAAGYWANNGTFATYSNIHTFTIDVNEGEKYSITAGNYFGMCVGVFYKGNDISTGIVQLVHYAGDSQWNYDVELVVPAGAEHLLIQQYAVNLDRINYQFMLYLKDGSIRKTPISGKLIAYNGDSICEGRYSGTAQNGGAYAKLISEAVGCRFENRGVSGGILASAVPSGSAPGRFVVTDVPNMTDLADLICFEGGLNDFYRDVPLGDYDPDDYTGANNTATVCGALESIFKQATAKWVGKPICFVIVHRCWSTKQPNNAGYTFQEMREKMIGICNKYAIPYYDAYSESGLNAYNSIQNTTFLTAGSTGQPDGMHPNEAGYESFYVSQLISLFEKIIPR